MYQLYYKQIFQRLKVNHYKLKVNFVYTLTFLSQYSCDHWKVLTKCLKEQRVSYCCLMPTQ